MRQTNSRFIAFLAVALVTVAAGAAAPRAQAAVGATYRPDGRISQPCYAEVDGCRREWFGNNVYNTNAAGQKAVYVDYPNFYDVVTTTFRVVIQNDGNRNDQYRVIATGKTAGYKVKFFVGTTNVTRRVRAGTFTTPVLAPGAKFVIKARVIPVEPVDGDKTVRLITFTSAKDSTKKDAVKLVRTYDDFTCSC